MEIKDFQQQYLCEWPKPTEEEMYLFSLAEEYHRRTEEYDRTVCSGPIKDGSIRPATGHELMLVNRNAIAVKHELQDRAEREHGIKPFKVMRAIQYYR